MRRDTIFYQLFRQLPTLLFELLAQPPERADEYVFDAVEVKETSFRIDGVFLPPTNRGIVYFCEVQFQLDELLYERMNSEIGIYTYRNRERFSDWRAVVIYPSRSIEQSRTEMVREMLASGRITRIYLDELGEIEDLPIGLSLMVLTTLEGDVAKNQARRAIERSQGNEDIIGLVSTIILYKFNALSRDEVDAMLGIELQQTRVYQEAKAEGLEIGQQQEKALVLKQLTRKLGDLSSQTQAKVSALPIDRIESLGEALLDFSSLSDLESWLSQN
jgi:predicted transposase/invertase (TIGR01784 family)